MLAITTGRGRKWPLWVKVGPSTIYARCPDYPLQADLRASSPLVSEVPTTVIEPFGIDGTLR
jgi:hypothetical protein